MSEKRGQAAVELIIILAIALVIILSIIALNQKSMTSVSGQLEVTKARAAIDDIADAAELVYQQGTGSRTRVYLTLPKDMTSIIILGQTITINMYAGGQPRAVYRNLDFNVSGSIGAIEGRTWVTLESTANYVSIGEVDDTTAPSVIASSPSGTINDDTPQLSATTDESSICKYDTFDVTYGSMGNNLTGTGTSHTTKIGPLTDGVYTYYVRCQDITGNTMTSSATITFTIDTTAPTLTFVNTTPANNAVVIDNFAYINVTTSETATTVYLQWQGVNETMSGSGTNFFLNKTSLANQNYTYTVYASDGANTGMSETRVVTINYFVVDITPPAIIFVDPTPANATTVTVNYVYVNTTITDDFTVSVALLEWNGVNQTITGTGSNYFVNKTGLANAVYVYSVYANDTSGNWNSTETRTVTVNVAAPDTTPPTVALITPANNNYSSTGNVTFTYNVTDIGSSISSCSLLLNSSVNQTTTSPAKDTILSFSLTNMGNGVYLWNVNCTDTSGNIGSGTQRTLNVTRPQPTAPIAYTVKIPYQACAAEDSVAKGTFSGACDDLTFNALLSDDASYETHTYTKTSYAGIMVTSYNASATNCLSITTVNLCYKTWTTRAGLDCDVSVDADNGASYTVLTTTCPALTEPATMTCIDVTASEAWICANFFGATGTRALAKSEIKRESAGAGSTETATWDMLYFNVTYTGS